jgi:chromosome condensin MukBEF complex kleisin-like MukF subunit
MDEITGWLASVSGVAKADGNLALAEMANKAVDELARLRLMERWATEVANGEGWTTEQRETAHFILGDPS